MQENLPIIQGILNIKLGTLIAGLLGAFITMLRKSQGSLQARLIGYVTAIATVLYVLPFLSWLIEWKFNFVLHDSADHLLAFILGMTAQRLTENFIDDPSGSIYAWAKNVKKFKRTVWNNDVIETSILPPVPVENDKKILTDNNSEDKK